jgi:hypothetical protein
MNVWSELKVSELKVTVGIESDGDVTGTFKAIYEKYRSPFLGIRR